MGSLDLWMFFIVVVGGTNNKVVCILTTSIPSKSLLSLQDCVPPKPVLIIQA